MEHQEMVNGSLIQIHPALEMSATCPKCQSGAADIHDFLFQGIHVLADCTCRQCATRFFETLPTGHDAITPTAVSHDGKYIRYDLAAKVWLAVPLVDSLLKDPHKLAVEIRKKNIEALKDKVIILNCLDDCFGHAFAKLLNAQQLMKDYPGHSLVLLITANLEWLVPIGVAELWIVPASMHNMRNFLTTLQGFVKSELQHMSQCFLSTAKVFHRLQDIDSELFLKLKRFDLSRFDSLLPTVTFVLREDRYWHTNRLDEFINLASIKFRIRKYFKGYFVWQQDRLVRKATRLILKTNPNVQINIAGIGETGRISDGVTDLRTNKITTDIERHWCSVYARSHVIVGVHGSNMLIPTSLAAGFIEIVPKHKIPHIGEDTVLHHPGSDATLLAVHVDAFLTPVQLARRVIQMLKPGSISSAGTSMRL